MLLARMKGAIFYRLIRLSQLARIWKYRFLSTCNVKGKPILHQPVQFLGKGEVLFRGVVNIGVYASPYFYNGYSYIEARNPGTKVSIGNGTCINNNVVICAEHTSVSIGENVLVGTCVEIIDSNFHGLEPDRRRISHPDEAAGVVIEDNVFIGSHVKVLKGVTIGRDSVIASGSVVVKSIPAGVIAGGNPAKILKEL